MGIAVTAVDWESRRESDALTRTLTLHLSISVPVLGELLLRCYQFSELVNLDRTKEHKKTKPDREPKAGQDSFLPQKVGARIRIEDHAG